MSNPEGSAINIPLLFDETKYAFWKACMTVFLKSLDWVVWEAVADGWTPPIVTESEGTVKPLEKAKWSATEKAHGGNDAKALNAITCAMNAEEYKKIMNCNSTKQAWDLLETTYERTTVVKRTKLQMLTSQFETIRMKEDEKFDELNNRWMFIVNEMWALDEPLSDGKICSKILRSLLDIFHPKVTSIKEYKDPDKMKVGDLASSLKTFEMEFDNSKKSPLLSTHPIDPLNLMMVLIKKVMMKMLLYLIKHFKKDLTKREPRSIKRKELLIKIKKEI